MRNSDGTLNGDLNDGLPALTSGSIARYDSSSLDENQTTYDLLPVVINRPPSIIASITETSTPKIKPYSTANATGEYMHIFPDESVKINLGASITLKLEAEQPSIFNIENGIPKIIPSKVGLVYVWKKDGNIITSYTIESLQSTTTVDNGVLDFINIQPEHAGTYTCEVSNDIGTTVSEPITIEILNLDFDSFFYKNLVQNPYGKNGTDNWESTTSDLLTKPFSETPSQEFTRPTAMNLFGYTPDMLHPRPYQIDTGVIKGFDMTKDLLKGGTFFTRTRYKFDKKGGTHLVRAYQDIDLSDIEWLIKGGVYGVEGVRAVFSCYIGNALDAFIPTDDLIDPTKRINSKSYLSTYPRISVENFLNSGPSYGCSGKVYVTVEEYDNETRLASRVIDAESGGIKLKTDRVLLNDPWNKRIGKYWTAKYYRKDQNGRDKYGLGFESNGDGTDMVLFTADELLPDMERRYTYGQYVEFNKVVFDKLNPNTTKIRITMHFETGDGRIFETYKPTLESSDEPYEFIGWQRPYKKHTFGLAEPNDWTGAIVERIRKLPKNKGKEDLEIIPTSPDPRGMVTALNLTLIPILTQDNNTTEYYTNQTLNLNDTPVATIPSGLQAGRGYDPYGTSTRRLNINFKFNVEPTCNISNDDVITQQCTLEFGFTQTDPKTQQSSSYPLDMQTLYPFGDNAIMYIEGVTTPLKQGQELTAQERTSLNTYVGTKYAKKAPNQTAADDLNNNLNGFGWVVNNNDQTRISEPTNDTPSRWSRKARFQLNFALPSSSAQQTFLGSVDNSPMNVALQSYFLNLDFTSGSKVTLSRPSDLYPGRGSASFELSHSITPLGKLICQIPNKILSGYHDRGGMEYVAVTNQYQAGETYPISASGDLIQCVAALHRNVGDYLKPNNLAARNYYNSLGAKIVEPLTRDLAYLQSTSSVDTLYYKWDYYQVPTVGMTPPSPSIIGVSNIQAVKTTTRPDQVFYVYVQPPTLGSSNMFSTIVETGTIPTSSLNYLTVTRSFGQPSDPIMYWIYPSAYTLNPQLSMYYTGNTNPPPIAKVLSQVTSSALLGSNLYVWVNNLGSIIESSTPPNANQIYNEYLTISIPITTFGYGNYTYSGSFDFAAIAAFSQSLATYIQDKTKPTSRSVYKNISKDYKGIITVMVKDVRANCTVVPTNLAEISQAQFDTNKRPSLYGIKPVDPGVFNDGVGSPSYGTDDAGDWSITYKPIDDSYSKIL